MRSVPSRPELTALLFRATLCLASILTCLPTQAATFEINIEKRLLYGPGPFPDQHLGVGHVRSMNFGEFMTATVPAFNNGPAEPNVSGEAAQGKEVNGKMSDGTLINENIDMGNAVIVNGQFNLILGAVFGGPSKGSSHFYLDPASNWTIHDDIAMDPGFPEGIVKINDFTFSTGPRVVPYSIQTQKHYPGGVDRVGSLQSGDIVIGRVGDDDFDGHVDGVFFAMGQLPLTAPFLPGSPFVQRMEFTSTIPISALEAAVLSASSARNCWSTLASGPKGQRPELARTALTECVAERRKVTAQHLVRATENDAACGAHCAQLRQLAARLERVPTASPSDKPASAGLHEMRDIVTALAALRSPCAYCSVTGESP